MDLSIDEKSIILDEDETSSTGMKIRCIVAGVCFFVIFLLAYMYEMDKGYFDENASGFMGMLLGMGHLSYLPRSIISGLLLLVAALCGKPRISKGISYNKLFAYVWLLMNLTFIIAGLFHDIEEGFLISQIFVFIAVPLFYLGWMQRGNLDRLYTVFAISVAAFYLITVIVCIIWFPYGSEYVKHNVTASGREVEVVMSTLDPAGVRYMGLMPNPSRIAHFATPAAICSLYLIYRAKGYISWLPAITLGASVSMAVLAISRASIISIALAGVGFLVIYFREKLSWKKLLISLLSAVIAFNAGYFLVNRGQDKLDIYSNVLNIQESYAANEADEKKQAEDEDSQVQNRFKLSGTINGVASGRVGIWLAFINRMNLQGHDVRYYYPLRVMNPDNNTYFYFSYPHNVVIDYGYRCGLITGILFLLLEIMGLVYCLKTMFSRKRKPQKGELFAVMGILAFMVTGNVESVDHVFTRIILVVFYLSLIPVFAKKEK